MIELHFWVLICIVLFTASSYHVTFMLYNESTLFSCMSVKELLAQNRYNM